MNTTGRTTAADRCLGGELVLFFDQQRGEELSGTAYYESDDTYGERFRSTSRFEGWLRGDEVVLEDTEIIEADALPDTLKWCSGKYTLSHEGRGDGMTFAGVFESADCGCRNETALGRSGR